LLKTKANEPKRTRGATEMIRVTVEVRDGAVSRRVRITAPSIGRAFELAGGGQPGKEVRVVFPIDPESFFAGAVTLEGAMPAFQELIEAV
jgi:hypothetical protein